jgi:hypothetical protein
MHVGHCPLRDGGKPLGKKKKTPLAPYSRPWGRRRRRSPQSSLQFILRACSVLRLLLAAARLIVPGPRVRLRGLWSLVRRSVGVDGGDAPPLLSPDPPRYGRAAVSPMPPPARGTGLSLARQLLLSSMPGRFLEFPVRCLPAGPGRSRRLRCGSSSRTLPYGTAIYCRRNSKGSTAVLLSSAVSLATPQ